LPLALPQSSFTRSTAHAFRRSPSYQGLDPHHDLTRSRPLIIRSAHAGLAPDLTGACARHSDVAVGFQTSRFGPSSGVLSLSTVCSAIGLAGLFRPAAMSRVPPFRGLLSPCSSAVSSTAPCPLAFRLVQAHRLPGCHSLEPRLRGFAPHEAALHQQSGEPRQCPLPSRFPAPPGAPSLAGRAVLLGPFRS